MELYQKLTNAFPKVFIHVLRAATSMIRHFHALYVSAFLKFAAAGRKRRVSENEVPWRLLKFRGQVVPERFSKFQMVKVILDWLGLVFRQAMDCMTLLRN